MAQAHRGVFVADGLAIDYTPGSDIAAGDVVVQQNIVGIAKRPIKTSVLGALAISGVFDVVKAQEALATVGANIYWDLDGDPYNGSAGTGCITATPGVGNTWCGCVLVAALETDETVRILLRSTVSLVAEEFGIEDLSDVDAAAYTAGHLLVADGDSWEGVAVSGPFTLSAAGLVALASATVAAAGSIQGDAGALAQGFTLVSAADGTKGVVLPAAAAGAMVTLKNNSASILKLWPGVGDAIDAIAANGNTTVPGYGTMTLAAYDVTTWYSEDDPPTCATVAAAGTVQADAALVALGFTLVSAADAAKGVKLPAARVGTLVTLKNNGNAILKVWPNTDDAIDAVAANSNTVVPAYGTMTLVCYDATTWYSEYSVLTSLQDIDAAAYTAGNLLVGTGTKYGGVAVSGPFTLSAAGLIGMASATVAATGANQGNAAAVAEGFTLVSAADGTKGVILPTAVGGAVCVIKNNVAQTLEVYPNTTDEINALGADTAITLANSVSAMFVAYDATNWYTVPLLPS